MFIFIKCVGVLFACLALVPLTTPHHFRKVLEFWKSSKAKLYLNIAIRFVLGALFIWSSPACASPYIILTLGAIIFLSGILLCFITLEKWRSFLSKFQNLSDTSIRFFALLPLGIALLIFYAA